MIFLLFVGEKAFAYGVNPLSVEVTTQPGEREDFEIKLTSTGREEIVNLLLYNPVQNIDGSLNFAEGNREKNTALEWIDFENERIVIPPEQEVKIKGTIDVPYNAGGSYTAILMVEPEKRPEEVGIIMQVRYAVRIDIFVDKPGLRPRGEITKIGITGDKEMNPRVFAKIKNLSEVNLGVASEVTIRTEDRRLLERVDLRSPATSRSGRDYLVIYRDSEVQFEGEIAEPLPAGTYDVRVFMRYNNGRQLVKSEKITIGNEYYHPDRIKYLDVEPDVISENIRVGAAVTKAIKIKNRVDDELTLKVGSSEIEEDYPYSVFSDFEFELRGKEEFNLKGRRESRQVLVTRYPRDIKPGGYYGNIVVQAYDEKGNFLETQQIPIDIIVGNPTEQKVVVENLNVNLIEDKLIFGITAENRGSYHITPEAKMRLYEGEQLLRTYNLYLQEDVERILPIHSAVMITEVEAGNIDPGEYRAEVTVEENKDILLEKEFMIKVPGQEEDEQ